MGVIKTIKLLPMKADQHQGASSVMKTVTQTVLGARARPPAGGGPARPCMVRLLLMILDVIKTAAS